MRCIEVRCDTRLLAVLERIAAALESHAEVRPTGAPSAPPVPTVVAADPTLEPADIDPRPPWSQERDTLVLRDWPRPVPVREIQAAINALPGPPRTTAQIAVRAAALHLRRPDDFGPAMQMRRAREQRAVRPAPAIQVALPKPPLPSRSPNDPVLATLDQIAHWAGPRGIQVFAAGDVEAVNRKRKALGLPPFVLLCGPGRRPMAEAA